MMHRCSSSDGGSCCCGFFHSQNKTPFSMIFSHKAASCNNKYELGGGGGGGGGGDHHHMYSFGTVPVVDCTLSLGTPSTRLITSRYSPHEKLCTTTTRANANFRTSNCGDLFQPNINSPYTTTTRGSANFGGGGNNGCETLLARQCANCDTTSTPLWRNGPKGPKSLCNACGIRYKKEERRATAAAAATTTTTGAVETQNKLNNMWVHHSHNQKASYTTTSPYGNEFRFIQEDDTGNIPFLSWRLNVTDRPGLIHNLTT